MRAVIQRVILWWRRLRAPAYYPASDHLPMMWELTCDCCGDTSEDNATRRITGSPEDAHPGWLELARRPTGDDLRWRYIHLCPFCAGAKLAAGVIRLRRRLGRG